MFAPTKTWRRWHHKINQNQRRYAVTSALAATALPSLNMARGHRVEQLPEVPLVVNESIESTQKTSAAVKLLKALNAFEDVEKCKSSKKIRAGKVHVLTEVILLFRSWCICSKIQVMVPDCTILFFPIMYTLEQTATYI